MKIEIKRLHKAFGKHVIFKDYDLLIKDKSFTLIKGQSGSGKSTLLNMIGHLEKYDEGVILYDDAPLKDVRTFYKDKVSFIFQNFALVENMTVYQNLDLLLKIRKLKKDTKLALMKEALLEVGLSEDILESKIYELSGGEMQRVALCKVLLKKPDLLLADEPTASLDKINARSVLNIFKKLHQKGMTIVVVSHSDLFDDYAEMIIDLKVPTF